MVVLPSKGSSLAMKEAGRRVAGVEPDDAYAPTAPPSGGTPSTVDALLPVKLSAMLRTVKPWIHSAPRPAGAGSSEPSCR